MTAIAHTRPVGQDAVGEQRIKLLHLLALADLQRLEGLPDEAATATLTRRWRRQFGLETLKDFAAWLAWSGLDLARFRASMTELTALARLLERRRGAVEQELSIQQALGSVARFRDGWPNPGPLIDPAGAEKVALTRLLAREEAGRLGLTPSPERIEARGREWRQQRGLSDPRTFARWQAFAGINPGRFRQAMADLLAVDDLLERLAPAIEARLPDFRALHSVRAFKALEAA